MALLSLFFLANHEPTLAVGLTLTAFAWWIAPSAH
jgi:hypothetical protein